MRSFLAVAAIWLAFPACHQPEQPPLLPTPTAATNPRVIAFHTNEVIDASIVSEGGRARDAAAFELDGGLSFR